MRMHLLLLLLVTVAPCARGEDAPVVQPSPVVTPAGPPTGATGGTGNLPPVTPETVVTPGAGSGGSGAAGGNTAGGAGTGTPGGTTTVDDKDRATPILEDQRKAAGEIADWLLLPAAEKVGRAKTLGDKLPSLFSSANGAAWIESAVDWYVDRAKQEIAISIMLQFKKVLTTYPKLKELFPSTCEFMLNLDYLTFSPTGAKNLRKRLREDLANLPEHVLQPSVLIGTAPWQRRAIYFLSPAAGVYRALRKGTDPLGSVAAGTSLLTRDLLSPTAEPWAAEWLPLLAQALEAQLTPREVPGRSDIIEKVGDGTAGQKQLVMMFQALSDGSLPSTEVATKTIACYVAALASAISRKEVVLPARGFAKYFAETPSAAAAVVQAFTAKAADARFPRWWAEGNALKVVGTLSELVPLYEAKKRKRHEDVNANHREILEVLVPLDAEISALTAQLTELDAEELLHAKNSADLKADSPTYATDRDKEVKRHDEAVKKLKTAELASAWNARMAKRTERAALLTKNKLDAATTAASIQPTEYKETTWSTEFAVGTVALKELCEQLTKRGADVIGFPATIPKDAVRPFQEAIHQVLMTLVGLPKKVPAPPQSATEATAAADKDGLGNAKLQQYLDYSRQVASTLKAATALLTACSPPTDDAQPAQERLVRLNAMVIEATKRYEEILTAISTLHEAIVREDYATVTMTGLLILAEYMPYDQKLDRTLYKWIDFGASIADAKTDEDRRAVLDAVADPVGEFLNKRREDGTYFGVNGYLGGMVGYEHLRTNNPDIDSDALAVGVFAPVGFELGWSTGMEGWSYWGVFGSVVDVGKLASARLTSSPEKDDDTETTDPSFEKLIAPGLFFIMGFTTEFPLTAGIGVQYVTDLREDPATNQGISGVQAALFLAIDVPLYRF